MIRKPTFWVALIIASFALNLLVAVVTLHRHTRYQDDRQAPMTPVSFPVRFGTRSMSQSDASNGVSNSIQTPESVLWRRLLQQELSDSCGERSGFHPKRNGTIIDDSKNSSLLPPLGFRRHVQQFVEATSSLVVPEDSRGHHLRGALASSKQDNGTATKSDDPFFSKGKKPTCFLPPSTACDEHQYSVIVYSRAQNLRRLLLNLMSFQSYPTVRDITLIVPSAEYHDGLERDTFYGSRILEWKHQGTIQIKFESTLWFSVSQIEPETSAVLWVNGDSKKDWSGTGLLMNFRIWQQHSRSLVASSAIERSHTSAEWRQNPAAFQCPQNRLHGTFVHRNWFCFLNHPVMRPLKTYLQQLEDWDTIFNGLSILWNQLGEGHFLTLPPNDPMTMSQQHEAHHKRNNSETRVALNFLAAKGFRSSNFATIVDYFGCACSVNALVASSTNYTCVQNQESQDPLSDIIRGDGGSIYD